MYPTYPAAGSDPPKMKPSNQQYAYVSSAVGGSLSQVFLGDNPTSRVVTTHSRGIRVKIRGFSRASRTTFLKKLASIYRPVFRAYKGRLISVDLTYPGEYPEDPQICKGHLEALHKRLKRRYEKFPAFWRMGIQRRGAWHFHLLLFVPPSFGSVVALRDFIASSWYQLCGKLCEGHLLTGIRVKEVR